MYLTLPFEPVALPKLWIRILPLWEEPMGVSRYAVGLGILVFGATSSVMAAEASLSAFQGAWLNQSVSCEDVYASAGKGVSFRKPVNIFAPAFIVSGNRLRTPQASCRIKSIKPAGDRQALTLGCANSVSASDVTVLMTPTPDGSLKRYFNEQDKGGTLYMRCDR
jgi:hypothetical protein